MKWSNDVTQLLDVQYPIVQAPMFGVTTPQMVAAAVAANCLGNLSLADLDADKCIAAIQSTKKLCNRHFAVNIFVNHIPAIDDELRVRYSKTKDFIINLAKEHRLDVHLPEIDDININTYQQQIDAIISEGCKIVSFTFGNLDIESISKLKSHGILLIGTCTSVSEALVLEASGIDLICVQGIEAGGHRGSFSNEIIPQIGGLSLLSQVYESVKVPVIYAGGIYNARTLTAARMLGAKGFQVGSILLAATESALTEAEKQRLKRVQEEDIILTKSFSGRYARGINNTFINAMEQTNFILPYPYQNKLTGALRQVARASGNTEFVNIWLGQSISNYSEKSTTDILQQLIKETELFQ